MKALFTSLLLLAGSVSAHAAEPTWLCGIDFQGKSEGVQIILGGFKTEATGRIRCNGQDGKRFSRPVRISISSNIISPEIGFGSFEFVGGSAGISLFSVGPNALLGDYLVEQGHVALGGGVGAFVAERLAPPQIALQISMQLVKGVGFDVGIHKMTISAM